jgi:hypothetical protein
MRAKPVTINGVTFRQHRDELIAKGTWVDDDLRLRVRAEGNTYEASINFRYIMGANPQKPKRFKTRDAAMRAAIKGVR